MQVNNEKTRLREKYKAYRKSLSSLPKREMDIEIMSRILTLPQYYNAKKVLLYSPTGSEIYITPLIDAIRANHKQVAFPKCVGENLEYYLVKSELDLEEGAYNIMEPDTKSCERLLDFSDSIVIVPALSYDIYGYRLGYGKGYYDRFLKDYKGTKVGVCYNSLVVKKLPVDKNDIPVDMLITEIYSKKI